jgi:2'-5' RNA ligase
MFLKGHIMNWYKLYKLASEKEYSWVAIEAPEDIAIKIKKFQKEISKDDLFIEKNNWHKKGLELFFHITVKFGIEIDDPEKIKEVLKNQDGGEVFFDKIDFFAGDENDVLIVKCKSKSLAKMHKILKDEVKNEEKFPNYTPHITVAYLKKGKGKKYKEMAEKELGEVFKSFKFNEVFFEDKDNNRTNIKL